MPTSLITGGTQGIGFAIAQAFLTAGYNVVITGRQESRVQQAVTQLAHDGRVLGIEANCVNAEACERSVIMTIERFGSLDVLVNNAGVNPYVGPLMDCPMLAVEHNFSVNTFAPITYTQLVWREWMAAHGGVVINVASIAGLSTTRVLGAYAASKAALIHLTRELAWELAPRVRVCAIAPGVTDSSLGAFAFRGRRTEAEQWYPLGRIAEPAEVASAVVFLASPSAGYLTGVILPIDGGMSSRGYPDPVTTSIGYPDRTSRLLAQGGEPPGT